MALTTIDVHIQILEPVTSTPAEGTVTFKILQDLRDTVDNVVYAPQTFVATLDVNGEATITLPTTDNPDVTPLDWTYWVYVDTDIWQSGVFYMALPEALGPVAEFADIIPILSEDCTPDGTACAPISLVGQVAAIEEAIQTLITDVAAMEVAITAIESDVADLQVDLDAVEVTVGALVGQVNVLTPIVLQSQTDIGTLQGEMVTALADIATLQGQMTVVQGQIATIQANAGLTGPTVFVNMTPVHANITLGAVAAATRLDRGGDNGRVRGFLQATGVVPATTVLANIATVSHRPLHNVSLGVRYTAGSSRLQILTNGDITLGSALALNDQVWLDSTTYDLLA